MSKGCNGGIMTLAQTNWKKTASILVYAYRSAEKIHVNFDVQGEQGLQGYF